MKSNQKQNFANQAEISRKIQKLNKIDNTLNESQNL